VLALLERASLRARSGSNIRRPAFPRTADGQADLKAPARRALVNELWMRLMGAEPIAFHSSAD